MKEGFVIHFVSCKCAFDLFSWSFANYNFLFEEFAHIKKGFHTFESVTKSREKSAWSTRFSTCAAQFSLKSRYPSISSTIILLTIFLIGF